MWSRKVALWKNSKEPWWNYSKKRVKKVTWMMIELEGIQCHQPFRILIFQPSVPKGGVLYIRRAPLVTKTSLNIYWLRSKKCQSYPYRKVNPNIKGKVSWSPLEIAVQSGFFQIVNMLLDDKRMQINTVNFEERGSALHIAAKSNYLPIC